MQIIAKDLYAVFEQTFDSNDTKHHLQKRRGKSINTLLPPNTVGVREFDNTFGGNG